MSEQKIELYDGAVVKSDGTVDAPARRSTDLPADAPWWARWLADNWKSIHREWSSWFLGAVAMLATAAEMMPVWVPQASLYVSERTVHIAIIVCVVASYIAKYIRQKGVSP